MVNASVAKLNQYSGDPAFERIREDFIAAQEDGAEHMELDTKNLEDEIRMDFMHALLTLGYDVGYSSEEQLLEVWIE